MSYVRNAWYVAGWSDALDAGKPVAASILGEPLVLWRSQGRTVALEDRCVHRLAPLSLGRCEGANLRCLYHGLLFDSDGAVIEIPGQELIPRDAQVRAYPAIDRHGWTWVWMGDAVAADPALIPPMIGLDDPSWIMGRGEMDYAAEARLINDNLLDFSHLPFLHPNSFASGPAFAEEHPRVIPLERGLRFEQWNRARPWRIPERGAANAEPQIVDRWMTYDYLVPGILIMWSANYPLGTAERLDNGVPDRNEVMGGVACTCQAVLPIAPGRARYFFTRGAHVDHGDERTRDAMLEVVSRAFAEDREMIEAQQRVIDRSPGVRPMPTAHDRAVTLFNRLVERLSREEQAVAAA